MANKRKRGARYPGGQLRRLPAGERAEEAKAVGIEARLRTQAKEWKLSREQAGQREAGYAIGRLWLSGELSPNPEQNRWMCLAAEEYARVVAEHKWAIDAEKGIGSPGDLNRSGGHDAWDYDCDAGDNESERYRRYRERCQAGRRRMAESERAILDAMESHQDHMLAYALNVWAIDDKEAWGFLPQLRLALNALVRCYRVDLWENPRGQNRAA